MSNLLKICILFLSLLCACKKIIQKEAVDPRVGVAPYALLHPGFPCNDFIDSIKNLDNLHISILWNTFGQDLSCLGRVLRDKRMKSLQVHLINETCMRANRCGHYEIFDGNMNASQFNRYMENNEGWVVESIKSYTVPVVELLRANKRPGLEFYISPGLESNLSDRAAVNLINIVKPMFNGIAEVVWNPVKGSQYNGATYLELHPTHSALNAPCFYNLDGTSITFPGVKTTYHQNKSYTDIKQILNKYAHCKNRYLWHNAYNCGLQSDRFIDPRQRQCRNWDGVFQKITSLITNTDITYTPTSTPQPIVTTPITSNKNPTCSSIMGADGGGGFLWKPKAEHKPNLVVLFPGKFKEKFKSVYVTRKDGVRDPLSFSSWSNPDSSGDRQTWRANRPGSSYKDYGLVEATDSRQTCKWKIGLSKDRTD